MVVEKFFNIYLFFKLALVVIGTENTGSCKFNYHTITTMTAPPIYMVHGFTYKQFSTKQL
jgi:hypothetical protein